MSPVDIFKNSVTGKGGYIVGYIYDGWTRELVITARNPMDAMMQVDRILGSLSRVTYVESNY